MKRKSSSRVKVVKDYTSGVPTLRVKNRKVVAQSVPRKVKVSGKLKAKILKVITKKVDHISGSYTDNFQGVGGICKDRQQSFLPQPGLTNFHLTTNQFLNAASVLFNNKAPPTSTLLACAGQAVGQFPIKSTKLEVRNSYSYYTFKNGTQHMIQLTLCICVPKKKSGNIEWVEGSYFTQNNEGASVANPNALLAPGPCWVQSLAEDSLNGLVINGIMPSAVVTDPSSVRAPSIDDMWRLPTESPTFKSQYGVEYVRLALQPGQVVVHKIQGPKNITIDYAKLYTGQNVMQNIQKYSRAFLGILINSPNAIATVKKTTGNITNAVAGRFADKIDTLNAGFGVFVERTDHYSITMPEQTGFIVPAVPVAAGGTQLMGQRRNRIINNNYFAPGPAAPDETFDVEVVDLAVANPQLPVANPSVRVADGDAPV